LGTPFQKESIMNKEGVKGATQKGGEVATSNVVGPERIVFPPPCGDEGRAMRNARRGCAGKGHRRQRDRLNGHDLSS
jgi:hypothetical protein